MGKIGLKEVSNPWFLIELDAISVPGKSIRKRFELKCCFDCFLGGSRGIWSASFFFRSSHLRVHWQTSNYFKKPFLEFSGFWQDLEWKFFIKKILRNYKIYCSTIFPLKLTFPQNSAPQFCIVSPKHKYKLVKKGTTVWFSLFFQFSRSTQKELIWENGNWKSFAENMPTQIFLLLLFYSILLFSQKNLFILQTSATDLN